MPNPSNDSVPTSPQPPRSDAAFPTRVANQVRRTTKISWKDCEDRIQEERTTWRLVYGERVTALESALSQKERLQAKESNKKWRLIWAMLSLVAGLVGLKLYLGGF